MKRLIKSVAIGVALGCAVLWCVPQNANAKTITIKRSFSIASGTVWGGVPVAGNKGDNLSPLCLHSTPFAVPAWVNAKSIVMVAHCPDTNYAGSGLTDTIHVGLETKPEGLVDSAMNDWCVIPSATTVGRCLLAQAAARPSGIAMTRFVDSDSTTANPSYKFYNAGLLRFSLWGPTNDTVSDAAITVDCYLTYDDGK